MDKSTRSPSPVIEVCFPAIKASVLDNLNRQREEGQLCDLSIHVQGQLFRAHRCVLAASSPYFHDQVLLKNVTTVSLPSVLDPLAFQSVLGSAYTGQLSIVREDIVNYVTVASFLQMWHIVDKCTEILKGARPVADVGPGDTSLPHDSSSRHQSPSSSDCCSTEQGGRGSPHPERRPSGQEEHGALPPLATWRRPQHPCRWSRPKPPPPSQTIYSTAEESSQYPSPEGTLMTGCASAPDSDYSHARQGDCYRSRSRHRAAQDKTHFQERGMEAAEEGLEKRRGDRWMEADEGVGEEIEQETVRVLEKIRQAGEGDPHVEDRVREISVKQQEENKVAERSFAQSRSNAADSQPFPEVPAPSQWAWPQQGARLLEGVEDCRGPEEEEDAEEDEMDFSRFADATFGGETYDEIEDGTGQVSQRPLLPASPDAGDFALEQSWPHFAMATAPGPSGSLTPGAGHPSSPSHAPHHSSSPSIPSSSSPLSLSGTSNSGKVHFCHCGKAYTQKSMRDRHVKMQHLNLRPFTCPLCAKSFKMKHHLTKHLKTHGGLRPYECGLCGKKVIWRDSFLRHQARCERLATSRATPGYEGPAGDDGLDQHAMDQGGGQVKVEQRDFQEEEGAIFAAESGSMRGMTALKEEEGERTG